MTIEITLLISAVSVAFAIFFGLKSNRRADEKEIVDKVERDTKINVKLDDIGSDVKEIRYDISETKKQVNEERNVNSNYNIRGFVCFPVNNLSTNSTRTTVS